MSAIEWFSMHNWSLITSRCAVDLASPTFTNLCVCISAHAEEMSSDYENENENDYGEDDSARSPGNLAKSTAAPLVPFFNQKAGVVHVDASASNVKIDCPVKNYDGMD